MKKTLRRLLALLLPAVFLLTAAQVPAAAKAPAELRLAIISDPHVYPADMTNGYCEAFVEEATHNGRAIEPTQALFEAALADLKARAKNEKLDYLLVAGDMTEWSEYAGHVLVAGLLRQFEKETGVPVAVIPGNHDLELGDACDFSSGAKEKARALQREEFLEVYADLGYDLPGCERFEGTLCYTADLGERYRLIAVDSNRRHVGADDRISQEELLEWVLAQCEKARADGKVIIGLGHYPLGEQIGNADTFMADNFGFGDSMQAAEALADAGMHFYFSGHLHFNEIAMRVSDSGEPLYDVMTASSGFFPGGYRTVKFSAAGEKITADVRSVPMPLTQPSPHPDDPYYDTFYGRCYGSPDGSGLAGWLRYAIDFALGPQLRNMSTGLRYIDERIFGQPEKILEALYGVADELLAMEVSALPCTRFIGEYGFGDPDKPGTFEDLGNSALVYLFGKGCDADGDAFVQDALRRMRDGEFLDQLLKLAVPKLVAALGGEILPLLVNSPVTVRALESLAAGLDCPWLYIPLLAVAAPPSVRKALSASLYKFAGGVMEGQSPTGSRDGVLVYDGPIEVPTGPETCRLPQEVSVSRGLLATEITWYTRQSADAPEVKITDGDGNPAPEVKVSIESAETEVMAGQLDIGYTKLIGRAQPALKHTARLTGLIPGKAYCFTAGDGKWGWWAESQKI